MRAIKTIIISILTVGLLAGSAVGVASQATVTGSVERFTCFHDDLEVFGQQMDSCADVLFETTDQRLNGTADFVTYRVGAPSSDDYEALDIGTDLFRLENEGGAWSGRGISYAMIPVGEDEEEVDLLTWLLVGEDGYEGLSAYLSASWVGGDLTGVIIERPLPLVPDEASAE